MDHQPDRRQAERDRHELPRQHVRLVRGRDVHALQRRREQADASRRRRSPGARATGRSGSLRRASVGRVRRVPSAAAWSSLYVRPGVSRCHTVGSSWMPARTARSHGSTSHRSRWAATIASTGGTSSCVGRSGSRGRCCRSRRRPGGRTHGAETTLAFEVKPRFGAATVQRVELATIRIARTGLTRSGATLTPHVGRRGRWRRRRRADLVVVGAGMVGGWASWFAATERRRAGRRPGEGPGRTGCIQPRRRRRARAGRHADHGRARPVLDRLLPFATGAAGDRLRVPRARLPDPRRHRSATSATGTRASRCSVRPGSTCGGSMREQACELNPTLATDGHRGGSYCATDGAIDPPRNVRAYSLAMQQAGVQLRERTPFLGLRTAAARGGRRRVTGVQTPDGVIATERVLLTGGPVAPRGRQARRCADLRGRRAPPGGRDRAASGVRRRTSADGLRRGRRDLLAPGGGRTALGHVEPEGDARTRARGRLAVPAAHGAPPAQARAR